MPSDVDYRGRLLELLASYSLRRGDFVLASGAKSTYYIDARLTTMRPEGLATIGSLALRAIQEAGWHPAAVGGLTLGADPVACAIAYASGAGSKPLRAFSVRKEAKTHGTQQLIEGPLMPGDDVVVVEDVLTTGRSALRAVEAVQQFGGNVLGVLAVVDREEGGTQNLALAGFKNTCLVTVSQLLQHAAAS